MSDLSKEILLDTDKHVKQANKVSHSDAIKVMRTAGIIEKNQTRIKPQHWKELEELQLQQARALAAMNMRHDLGVIAATRSRILAHLEARLSDSTTKDSAFASLASTWHRISVAPLSLTLGELEKLAEDTLSDAELENLRQQYIRDGIE